MCKYVSRAVYVNFDNTMPHFKCITGKYDKSESHLFFEVKRQDINITTYIAAGDYDINWTDESGAHHTEHLTTGTEYYFPKNTISDKPKF